MPKKYIIPGVLILALLVFWFAFGSDTAETPTLMASPETGHFEVTVTSSGELEAKNSTSITGPKNMRQLRISEVPILRLVPEGTVVKKGDFIAELDRSSVMGKLQDAQLNLDNQNAQFEQAQLDSALTLSKARDNIINLGYAEQQAKIVVDQSKYESPAVQRQAQIDYEKAQRALEQAKKNYKTQVKQAEANLRKINTDVQKERNDLAKIKEVMSHFDIYAPEKGMVIYERKFDGSKITQGSSISAWRPTVAELPDFSVMQSITYINEVDIQSVKKGQKVDIGLDAFPEKELTGVVTEVANIGEQRPNSNSKVFQVVVRVNQTDSTLRPAMTTSNKIYVNSVDSALFVPLETVHVKDSMDVVYKKEGSRPVMQQVVLGLTNKNDVIIKAGVQPKDRLYLSIPSDTSNIKFKALPKDVLLKYQEQEKKQKEKIKPEKKPQKRMLQRKRNGGPPESRRGGGNGH